MRRPSLIKLFLSFLALGSYAFGGPAMVVYIRDLAVRRNKWLDEDTFKNGVMLCQSVPGAIAMQTAAYVGLKTRGTAGAILSYLGFGLPASTDTISAITQLEVKQAHSCDPPHRALPLSPA